MSSAARQTRRVHLDGCGQAAVGLGFAAFGAELPELEARCHERLHYARPTVLAATEDPQGTRVLNLFARDRGDESPVRRAMGVLICNTSAVV